MDTSQCAHIARNISLLCSGQFSDFIVRCGEHEFKIHRAIVAGQSKYFDAILQGSFKEASQGYVELVDESHEVTALIIWYLYTGRYPHSTNHTEMEEPHRKSLLEYCADTESLLNADYSTHVKIALAAERYLLHDLAQAAMIALDAQLSKKTFSELMESTDFNEAMELIFELPNRLFDLSKLVAWRLNWKTWEQGGSLERLAELGREVPDLLLSLLMEKQACDQYRKVPCNECRKCPSSPSELQMLICKAEPEIEKPGRIYWSNCECRFQGFCSEECNIGSIGREQLSFYCVHCRSSERHVSIYPCRVMRTTTGKRHLELMDESFDCKVVKPYGGDRYIQYGRS